MIWDNATISKKSVFLTSNLEPVIIDSGASFCLTFVEDDFIESIRPSSIKTLQTVKDNIPLKGEGLVEWFARDINGQKITIWITALYVPEAHIQLFSPQIWLDTATKGSEYIMRKHVSCLIDGNGSELVIPYHPNNNLPIMFVSKNNKPSINITYPIKQPSRTDVFSSVTAETNQNLTAAQKELLLWHWKLSTLDSNGSKA